MAKERAIFQTGLFTVCLLASTAAFGDSGWPSAGKDLNNSRYQAETPVYARRSSTNSYGAQWSFGVKGTF